MRTAKTPALGPAPDGLARLAASLDAPSIRDIIPLHGGIECATYGFICGAERLVLKVFPPATGPHAQREFNNLSYARRLRITTPEPVALDEQGTWFGSPAFVMTSIPGQHTLRPIDETSWVHGLATALVAIHDRDIDDLPDVRQPLWECWEPWGEKLEDRMSQVVEVVDALRRTAPSETAVFSHADFHPGNVLFENDRLTGVVDWSGVTLEPREAAVANCRGVLAIYPGGNAPQRFLDAYQAEAGTRLNMELWDILYGARGLKGAHGRWPQAFEELGVPLTSAQIWDAAVAWFDEHRLAPS